MSSPLGDSPLADDASRRRELAQLRQTVDRLRDPAGAVRLAVQMLAGPLRAMLPTMDPATERRVEQVLTALDTATSELTALLGPTSAEPPSSFTPRVIDGARARPVDVEAMLERVCAAVRQRCALPSTLTTAVESGVQPRISERDLQTALGGLIENAIEASARKRPGHSPWAVELRVYLDAAEELGDEMHVVFEVRDRGDGLPRAVLDWARGGDGGCAEAGMSLQLARRIAEDAGGRLSFTRVSGCTRVCLRVPHG